MQMVCNANKTCFCFVSSSQTTAWSQSDYGYNYSTVYIYNSTIYVQWPRFTWLCPKPRSVSGRDSCSCHVSCHVQQLSWVSTVPFNMLNSELISVILWLTTALTSCFVIAIGVNLLSMIMCAISFWSLTWKVQRFNQCLTLRPSLFLQIHWWLFSCNF